MAPLTLACGAALAQTPPAQPKDAPPAARQPETGRSAMLERAQAAAKAGNWPEVLGWSEQLLRLDGDDGQALWMQGSALSQLGRKQESIAPMLRAATLLPNAPGIRTGLCWSLIELARPLDARPHCDKAVELVPRSFANTVNLGHTYLLVGDRASAWNWYELTVPLISTEEQLRTGPLADFDLFIRNGWQPALSREGRDWFESRGRRWIAALKDYMALLERMKQADAKGQHDEALAAAKSMVDLISGAAGPNHPMTGAALLGAALQHAQLSQFRQALVYAEQAQQMLQASGNPYAFGAPALLTLALINLQMNRFDVSLDQLRQAMALAEKEDPQGRLMRSSLGLLALLRIQMGQPGKAVEPARQALALAEQTQQPAAVADALATVAKAQGRAGNPRAALQAAERALALTEPASPSYSARLRFVSESQSELGDLQRALDFAQRALAAAEQASGPDSEDAGLACATLAASLSALGRYQSVVPLAERALRISERIYGTESPQAARDLNNLAQMQVAVGQAAKAIALYERSLRLDERFLGPEHPETATALSNMGLALAESGRYAEAEKAQRRALEITTSALGSDHPSTVLRLNNLATVLTSLGRASEAVPLLRQAVESARSHEGQGALATSLNNLALALADLGRSREALPLNEEALAIGRKTLGPEHPDIAIRLSNLALRFSELGEFEKARVLLVQAVGMAERTLGPEHPAALVPQGNLASALAAQGDYGAALRLDLKLLELTRRLHGEEHDAYALRLNNLGSVQMQMGRNAEAIQVFERALAIDERALGPSHPRLAATLGNLAAAHHNLGHLAEAASLAERSLAITQGSMGADHPDMALRQANLASLYMSMGRLGDAFTLVQRSMDLTRRTLGPDHPDMASRLQHLAAFHTAVGQPERALALERSSVAILEKSLGPDHPDTGSALAGLARTHRLLNEDDQAMPLLERALAIAEHRLGPDHPTTASRLNEIAHIHERRGAYKEALPLRRRALAAAEKSLGPDSPAAATLALNLASLLGDAGDPEAERRFYDIALRRAWTQQEPQVRFAVMRDVARYRARAGDLPSAIFFAKQAVAVFQGIRAWSSRLDQDQQRSLIDLNQKIYQDLARWLVGEGRIAEGEEVLKLLKGHEFAELTREAAATPAAPGLTGPELRLDREYRALQGTGAAQVNELESLKRQADLGQLTPEQESRRTRLEADQQRWRDDLQRFMASVQPTLSADREAAAGRRNDVEASSSALTGYIRESNEKTSLRHAALSFVVTDDSVSVVVTTAEGALARQTSLKKGELNARIGQLRQLLTNPKLDPRPAAQGLYRVLLGPVEAELAAIAPQVLVLNLTDVLRYVPFATLHDGQQYLVQRHALALYPSAGFRGVHTQAAASWQVAGLGLTQAAQVEEQRFPALESVAGELLAIVRDGANPQGALPGQAQVDGQFTRRAFEQALARARQGKAPVVHVASHFHLSPGSDYGSYLVTGEPQPLRLNAIREMNFNGVEMLTLSACNTASLGGRNENGSEIEGLAAIAQTSGAKSVMATLWPVADASTAALMKRFYEIRSQGREREETNAMALRKAQLELLEGRVRANPSPPSQQATAVPDIRRAAVPLATPPGVDLPPAPAFERPARTPFAHPYYWGPFVLMGNWL